MRQYLGYKAIDAQGLAYTFRYFLAVAGKKDGFDMDLLQGFDGDLGFWPDLIGQADVSGNRIVHQYKYDCLGIVGGESFRKTNITFLQVAGTDDQYLFAFYLAFYPFTGDGFPTFSWGNGDGKIYRFLQDASGVGVF